MLKPLIPPLAFVLAITAQAQATEMLTVECDEPVGVRFEFGRYDLHIETHVRERYALGRGLQ